MSEPVQVPTGDWYVDVLSSVKITVNDPNAVLRCVENHDDAGVPQPRRKGGSGWCDLMFPLGTVNEVMEHWAYNRVMNGVEQVNKLDGWADLPDDAVTMGLEQFVECERVLPPDDRS